MDFTPVQAESTQKLFDAIAVPVTSGFNVFSGPIDVRQFSSYYLNLDADLTVASTQYNSFLCRLTWLPNTSGDLFSILYRDVYEYWIYQNSGTALFPGGDLMIQDTMHGPYMNIDILNVGGDSKTIDYHLIGTTRQISHPFARQPTGFLLNNQNLNGNGNDEGPEQYIVNKLNVAIASGVTIQVPALFGYGRASERLAAGAGALTFTITAGFLARTIDTVAVGAGGVVTTERILPKRSLLYSVNNASGVASTFSITTITELSRS